MSATAHKDPIVVKSGLGDHQARPLDCVSTDATSSCDDRPREFTDKDIHETKEISENIYIDVDKKGNSVSMTIEHAKDSAGLWEFSYQEMSRQAA